MSVSPGTPEQYVIRMLVNFAGLEMDEATRVAAELPQDATAAICAAQNQREGYLVVSYAMSRHAA